MVDGINSVRNVSGVDAAASRAPVQAAAPVNADVADVTTDATNENETQKSSNVEDLPISPRLRTDYATGTVVTEYVGSNGDISQQFPSAAALAYLRAGLSAQGQPITAEQGAIA